MSDIGAQYQISPYDATNVRTLAVVGSWGETLGVMDVGREGEDTATALKQQIVALVTGCFLPYLSEQPEPS